MASLRKMLHYICTAAVLAASYSSTYALDNVSDSSSTGLVCPSTHFGCHNAYRCIQEEDMCNGLDDCGDNSDENLTACILKEKVSAQLSCVANEFQCKNGFWCVERRYTCDGNNDCKDHSDEDPNECIKAGIYDDRVTCADIGFMCGGGTGPCISLQLLCNGKNDCGDNTDEDVSNCRAEGMVDDELTCEDYKFRCKNNFKCVVKQFLCDHDNDCFDGSDEDPVECAKEGLVPEGTTCADLGFECKNTTFNGTFCIGNLFICDGKNNCGDNSDENPEICEQRSHKPKLEILPWYELPEPNSTDVRQCGNDNFLCGSSCTSKKNLCHPNYKCDIDESDERNLVCLHRKRSHKCMTHQFKCNNTKCVYKEHVCDGYDHCGDMSDEGPMTCNSDIPKTMLTTTRKSTSPRKRPLICKRDEFKCSDASKCIQKSWVCNGERECPDGSDETEECTKVGVTTAPATLTIVGASCGYGQFQCKNRRCILSMFVCDGDDDCHDLTDESPPFCSPSSIREQSSQTPISPSQTSCSDAQFRCSTLHPVSRCIPQFQVCDGTQNCPLGEDENSELCMETSTPMQTAARSANEVSCGANEFRCTDGRMCIPIVHVCDKSQDCDNGSDEDPSRCLSSSSQRPSDRKHEDITNDLHVQVYGITVATAALIFIAVVILFSRSKRV